MNLYKKLQQHMALNSYVEKVQSGTTSITLTDAIHGGLKEITAYGKTEQPAKTYLDSIVANGKTEIQRSLGDYVETDSTTNTAGVKIDTGIAADVDDMVFEIKVKPSTGSWYIFQARENNPIWGVSGSTTNNTILAGWNGNQSMMQSTITRNNTHTYFIRLAFKNGNGTLYVKDLTSDIDDTQTYTYTYTSGTTNNIYLFGNSTSDILGSGNVIYYAKLYKSGELVGYYIPAKDNQNVAGFYDAISGTFKTPTNGSLTAGTSITTPTVDPYNPVDIVCNNGVLKFSKNVFDETWEMGLYSPTNGQKSDANNRIRSTNLISIKPSTTYVVSFPNYAIQNNMRWVYFDSNKEFISSATSGTTSVTTPSNAYYVGIYIAADLTTASIPQCQIEKGSTATEYHPQGIYVKGIQETLVDGENNTATCENLFKTNSSYLDSHSIVDGVVTRKCAIRILDGSEDWNIATGHDNAFIGLFLTDKISGASPAPICSHFKPTTSWTEFDKPEVMSMILTNSNRNCVIKMVGIDTVDDFKTYLRNQYLNGTPVMVVYTLAEPVTETVNKQLLRKSPVSVTQASLSDLEVITTESVHTTPSPDYPLDIVCNNGKLGITTQGTPETITIKSKNLFDKTDVVKGYYISSTGVITQSADFCYSGLIPVEVGKTYTWSFYRNSTSSNRRWHGYNTNGDWVCQLDVDASVSATVGGKYHTITIPSGVAYTRLSIMQHELNTNQVEEGPRPTTYESYGDITINPKDLLGLNGYEDTQNILDGIVNHKVGIKVFDGTENWGKSGSAALYYRFLLNGATSQWNAKTGIAPCCTHVLGTSSVTTDRNTCCFSSDFVFQLTENWSIDTFKQWLADQYAAGTPVIVVYQLATPTTETVQAENIEITAGNSDIEIIGSIDNLKAKVIYKKLK